LQKRRKEEKKDKRKRKNDTSIKRVKNIYCMGIISQNVSF
jgi:hypothetical protein